MIRQSLVLLLFTVLISCGESEDPIAVPPTVLAKEKMALVMADIHIAEARNNLRTLPDSTSTAAISFQEIFEKDSVTKAQYEESLAFYVDHPALLDEVYVEVMNKLSTLQGAEGKQ